VEIAGDPDGGIPCEATLAYQLPDGLVADFADSLGEVVEVAVYGIQGVHEVESTTCRSGQL
jgi:hypothetical protein